MSLKNLIICDECDLLLREVSLEPGGVATCTRCGHHLYRYQPQGLERSLVFALTASALFIIANSFSIVTINSQGLTSSTTLLGAVDLLMRDDMLIVAMLVFATTFLMPALEIFALIYLLLPLKFGQIPPGLPTVFRVMYLVKPWAMIEVFMLGLLVTISKLNGLASVIPEIALGSFILLMFSTAFAATNFNSRNFWDRVQTLRYSREQA